MDPTIVLSEDRAARLGADEYDLAKATAAMLEDAGSAYTIATLRMLIDQIERGLLVPPVRSQLRLFDGALA